VNANELADKLMSSLTMEYDCDEYMEQAATMLRQQQAEIEALKSNPAFYEIVIDNHWVMRLWSDKLVNGHTWLLTKEEFLEFAENIK
jgi:stress response protein YsnF